MRSQLYDTYICDVGNDISSVGIDIEKDWWTSTRDYDDSVEKSKTIIFQGEEYTGTYTHSCINNYEWYVTDFYETDDYVEFSISRETGELRGINIKPQKNYWNELIEENVNYSAEEVEEQVKHFASEYIDLQAYVMEMTGYSDRQNGEITVYTYIFTKYINGIQTADRLWIEYTSKGTAVCVNWRAIGKFDDIAIPENAVEKTDLSVADKVQSVYAASYSTENAEVYNQILTYAPDGNKVIVSLVSVTLKTQDGDSTFDTMIKLATIIG